VPTRAMIVSNPASKEEFYSIQEQIENGNYTLKTEDHES